MNETISCVSDATAGCLSLDRLYYKAKLKFVYDPLTAACGVPNTDPPVTGKLCKESEAVKKLDELMKKKMEADGKNDYEDVCK